MTVNRNIIAFFVISILGTLGHFLYDITGENSIIGLFFSVNESTWEHLKLLFFPALLYFTFEYFKYGKNQKNFIRAAALSILFGMLTIVVLFYTYKGILGKNIDFINIAIYYIGVIATLLKRKKLLENGKTENQTADKFYLGILMIFILLFMVWTNNPPSLGIFTPPVTN